MVVVRKMGNNCHKDLSGVMANARFGVLRILGTDGKKHEIPQVCINKSGTLKKNWRDLFTKVNGYAIPA